MVLTLRTTLVPDWLIRIGNRRLLGLKLRMEERRNTHEPRAYLKQFVEELRHSPIGDRCGLCE